MRERKEKEAKDYFAVATNALREQQRLQKELEQELENMVQDRLRRRDEYSRKLASGEMKVTEQSSAARFIDRLKERETEQKFKIEGQKENVRSAEKELKRAQDALIIATQDLKALQKHKEKWAEEIKKERMAKEEDAMDEIGQVIFNKARKERN
jgi:flagellar export protein FliJ